MVKSNHKINSAKMNKNSTGERERWNHCDLQYCWEIVNAWNHGFIKVSILSELLWNHPENSPRPLQIYYIPEVRGDIEAGVWYNYRYSCIRQLFLQCTYLYLVYTLPVIKSFRPGLLYCTTGGNLADQVCCTAMLEEVLVLQTGSTVP